MIETKNGIKEFNADNAKIAEIISKIDSTNIMNANCSTGTLVMDCTAIYVINYNGVERKINYHGCGEKLIKIYILISLVGS